MDCNCHVKLCWIFDSEYFVLGFGSSWFGVLIAPRGPVGRTDNNLICIVCLGAFGPFTRLSHGRTKETRNALIPNEISSPWHPQHPLPPSIQHLRSSPIHPPSILVWFPCGFVVIHVCRRYLLCRPCLKRHEAPPRHRNMSSLRCWRSTSHRMDRSHQWTVCLWKTRRRILVVRYSPISDSFNCRILINLIMVMRSTSSNHHKLSKRFRGRTFLSIPHKLVHGIPLSFTKAVLTLRAISPIY